MRFSDATGLPTIADNDPNASPRGMAIRFHLAEHVHTDIIAHSVDGFPVRTVDEFVGLLRAIRASGPDAAKPTPIEVFLGLPRTTLISRMRKLGISRDASGLLPGDYQDSLSPTAPL